MSFPLRACFLPLPAVLLFMATPSQALALDDGHIGPLPVAASPEHVHSQNAPEEQRKRKGASPPDARYASEAVQQALEQAGRRPGGGCGFKPAETFSRISDAGREIQLEFQHDKAGAPELRNQHTAESAG